MVSGCAAGYANLKPPTPQEDNWKNLYIEANSLILKNPNLACEKFSDLSKKPTPQKELMELINLRKNEACKEPEDPTDIVTIDWLKAEAVEVGLKKDPKDPEKILKYIKIENHLPMMESLRLLYKQKKALVKNAIGYAKKKGLPPNELYDLFPTLYVDFNQEVPPELYSKVADDLRQELRFEESKQYYLRIIKKAILNYKNSKNFKNQILEVDAIFKAWMNIRLIYRLQDKKSQSVQITFRLKNYLLGLYKKNPKVEILKYYHDAVVQYARDVWNEGDSKLAFNILTNAEKILEDKFSKGYIFWLKGRIEQEVQNLKKASEWFKQANEQPVIKPYETELAWAYAWNELELKNLDNAITRFQKLRNSSFSEQDMTTFFKVSYWLAIAYKLKNQNYEANEIFNNNFDQNTFGYYGLLSKLELINQGSGSFNDLNPNINIPDPLIHKDLSVGYWLNLIGERELVGRYVSGYWREGSPSRKPIEIIESLLKLCDESEKLENSLRIMIDLDNETRKKIFQHYSPWFFSQPYLDLVQSSAKRFNVEKGFVYSVMRQESLLNEKARSPADAFGLLQILPREAIVQAKKIGVPYQEPEDLFEPEINIPIGTSLIAQKSKKFSTHSWLLTAAAYNAGEDRVKIWLKTRFKNDTLRFIENVPYNETQNYIKLIFRNFLFYIMMDPSMPENEKTERILDYFKIQVR